MGTVEKWWLTPGIKGRETVTEEEITVPSRMRARQSTGVRFKIYLKGLGFGSIHSECLSVKAIIHHVT